MKRKVMIMVTIAAAVVGIAAVAVSIFWGDQFLAMMMGFASVILLSISILLQNSLESDRYDEELRQEEYRRKRLQAEQMDWQYLEMDDDEAV